MKKFLAVLTVLCMVLSIGTAAFAEVFVDGESQGTGTVSVENAQYVSAGVAGDDLTVTGNVTGDSQGFANSVIAQNGAEITVGGEVTAELVWPGSAIQASNDSTKVTVEGAVTEKTNGNAINASFAATVEAGSVNEKNDGDAINASSGAAVEVGKVSEDGNGNGVSATGSETKVTVNGGVTEGADGSAISAAKGAEVTVKGYVSEHEDGNAISATEEATVTVGKYVNEDGAGNAVSATEGANVTVKGNVNEKGAGNAISATGADTKVTIEGNVTEGGTGSAINVQEATVIIVGNVEEANAGSAITATKNATVIVGGNVTDGVETAGASDGVISGFGATVIVEGLVTGDLSTNGQTNSGTIYLGELNGNIKDGADLGKIHYLVGLAENSAQNITDFNVTGTNNFSATSPVSGASGKEYFYTDSADPDILNNTSVTLTPRDSGKELTVSNLPAGVTSVSENGKLTLKFDSSFKGGLQNLLLILKDIAKQNPEVAAEIYVSAADYSNYVYVPEYSVTTTNAEVAVAAEELEEGAVKPFNLNNHTGVTLAPSVLGETEFYTIKVLKDSSELSASNYSFQMHSDGSVSLILSNTYLLSLENGTYDFTVMVNGQKIIFTVVVNQ